MPGVTGTAQIDNAVKTMVAESRYTMQERPGVVKSSIKKEVLPKGQGSSVNIPKFGTVTTFALTEGVDMAQAQQITDTGMSITPAEYGAQVLLTDMLLDTRRDDFFRVAGRLLGESFDRQQDQTLCDDFDNFSIALGTGGAAFTYGHASASIQSLVYNAPAGAGRGGEPGPGPYFIVHTPSALHSLNKTMAGWTGAAANTSTPPNLDAVESGNQFKLPGYPMVTVKSDINILKDSQDDAKGGAFSREAMILVTLGGEFDEERERDASLRAWELNIVGRWARGEYEDSWGRELLFDSALATS